MPMQLPVARRLQTHIHARHLSGIRHHDRILLARPSRIILAKSSIISFECIEYEVQEDYLL